MVQKILPLCCYHDQIEYFITQKSNYDYGLVAQALSSALKTLMKEYLLMVNQLDVEFNQGELTLQKLWYYVQPSIKVLYALHVLVTQTHSLVGGALLSRIFDLINNSTDNQIITVYEFLLEKTAQPYFRMLSQWLYYGEVEDHFEEFFIVEKKGMSKELLVNDYKDNYWD